MPSKLKGAGHHLAIRCPKTGKVQFVSELIAIKTAKHIRKTIGPKMKAYICPYCKLWHIGHNRPPEKRKNNRNLLP